MKRNILLNVGCGLRPIHGALNIDNSFSVILARHPVLTQIGKKTGIISQDNISFAQFVRTNGIKYGTCTSLPVKDGCADVVYASRVCEHLYEEELFGFIKESYRCLRVGGVLRIVIPDLDIKIKRYLEDNDADRFMNSLHLMYNKKKRTWVDALRLVIVGNRDHKWMYNTESFMRLICSNFKDYFDCYALEVGESKIEMPLVEMIDLYERGDDSIYIELVKK